MGESNCYITDEINEEFFDLGPRKLNFFYLNIRSLRKNFDLLLCNIHEIRYKIDVIILSETQIFEDEVGQFKIPGYNTFFNCNQDYRAGGIIIYIKDHIKAYEKAFRLESADILVIEMNYCNVLFHLIGV